MVTSAVRMKTSSDDSDVMMGTDTNQGLEKVHKLKCRNGGRKQRILLNPTLKTFGALFTYKYMIFQKKMLLILVSICFKMLYDLFMLI